MKKKFGNAWETIKDKEGRVIRSKIYIIRIPEREKREKGERALFEEIMAKNISKLTKNVMSQIQEHLQTARRINKKKSSPRYNTKQLLKIKVRGNLRVRGGK